MSAQTWTFDTDLEGFTQNFGTNGTVEWDSDGGEGALKLTRITNNANFGKGSNANTDASIVGIDADATPIIKIVIKNLTEANQLRVGAKGGDGTNGNANFTIAAETGSYETYYVDMTGEAEWNGLLTNFWIGVRQNIASGDSDAAYINSIELLASIPPPSMSGIVQNPSLEDLGGSLSPFSPASKTWATVDVSQDDANTGSNSLKHEYTGVPDATHFVFNNYIHDLGATTSDFIIGSIWVKVVRPSTPGVSPIIDVQGQGRYGTTLVVSELTTKSDNKSTTKTDGTWEQLNFTFTPDDPYSTAQFRYGIGMANLLAGDIVYIDDLHAEITATLTVGQNVLENVRLFPNPVQNELQVRAGNAKVSKIEVYSILGKKILEVENSESINVSTLSRGVYISKIFVEDSAVSTKRFVKE